MEYFSLISVSLLSALMSFMAHCSIAVFQDGLRPIVPEYRENRMQRSELGTIAFGLAIPFIVTAGFSYSLATGVLNPWILFLVTDIIGVKSSKKWIAVLLGFLWGGICFIGIHVLRFGLFLFPLDILGAMSSLASPLIIGFTLFPIVAVFTQFGWKKGVFAFLVSFFVRQVTILFIPISAEVVQLFVGIIFILSFSIANDIKNKTQSEVLDSDFYTQNVRCVRKNLGWLMAGGALIAIACNLGVFAGSEVSSFMMAESFREQAFAADFVRGLSFIPMIATIAVTTGVYGVAGFALVYSVGYLMPNPWLAAIVGAVVILLEVLLLNPIGRLLCRFPSLRSASDNIRSAITAVLEFSLLLGAMIASIGIGGYTGLFIAAGIYFINEFTGRRIMKIAIGPVALILTAIIVNVLHILGGGMV